MESPPPNSFELISIFAVAEGAILRYRAPFLRVIKHDAYFDAFNIVVESMLNRYIIILYFWTGSFQFFGIDSAFISWFCSTA